MNLDEPTKPNPKKINQTRSASKKLKDLYTNKYVYIALSVLGILFIWTLSLIPLLVRIIDLQDSDLESNSGGSSRRNQRNSNLTMRLPPLNITNRAGVTVISVGCRESFIYSPNDSFCFPDCSWDPFDGNIAAFKQALFILISLSGFLIGSVTLVGWLLTCCVDWKKKRIHFDFQLARASLFMVVLCTIILLLINLIVDIISRKGLFCSMGDDGQPYLPAHLNQYTSEETQNRIIINFIGALYHFLSLSALIWLTIAFVNILIIVIFPLRGRESLKKRVIVFLIESLIAVFVPVFAIVLAVSLDPDSPYGIVYTIQQIHVFDAWLNAVLNNWLYFFFSGIIITIAIIIVTKLRMNSLRSKGIMGKAMKLTELEKRLLIYSLVLIGTLSIIGTQLLVVNSLSDRYHELVEEYILCVTVNSPVLVSLGNVGNSTANSTAIVFRVNSIGDINVCNRLLLTANRTYPSWAYIILAIMFRVIWFIPIIVLLPCCSCRFVKKKPAQVIIQFSTKPAPSQLRSQKL